MLTEIVKWPSLITAPSKNFTGVLLELAALSPAEIACVAGA